jgi:hypothetical protein
MTLNRLFEASPLEPDALAIDRVLQWVTEVGMVSSVAVTTGAANVRADSHGDPD